MASNCEDVGPQYTERYSADRLSHPDRSTKPHYEVPSGGGFR